MSITMINKFTEFKDVRSEDITKENKGNFYEYHEYLVKLQGRKPAWIIKMLDCSYMTYNQYVRGKRIMSLEKVRQLHFILTGI